MSSFRWKLGDYLEAHGITAYELANAVGSLSRASTIYRLARKGQEPNSVNLAIMAEIVEALEKTTKKRVDISELLEFQRDDNGPS